MPLLHEVRYTDDEDKLFPKVRKCDIIDNLKKFIKTGKCNSRKVSTSYFLKN